jgi:anti-anti-sigma factor
MSVESLRSRFEPASDELLRCDVVPERESVRVCLDGALDLATVDLLEERLAELRAAGWSSMLLDLRGLEFMDSTGLRLVLRWVAAARADGFTFGVVPGGRAIQRVFELTGTCDCVPFVAVR